MKHTMFIWMAATILAGAAGAQVPVSKLDCSRTRLFVNGLAPYCEIRETTIPFNGALDAQTINGSIYVTSWDGPEILVRAQVATAADNQSLAAAVAARVTLETGAGTIVGRGPSADEHQQWSVALEIFVPPQTGLSLTTVNGSISVSGVRGPIEFNTTNGSVSIAGAGGDVRGHTVNGSITVSAGGDHWQGQTLDVRTVNGSIDLKVPQDCAAHVELSTVLGDISTDFPVSGWTRVGLGRKLTFDLGTSGLVRASTVLGRIYFTSVSTILESTRNL